MFLCAAKKKFLLRALLTEPELHRVHLTAMDGLRSTIRQLGVSYLAEVMVVFVSERSSALSSYFVGDFIERNCTFKRTRF